MKMHRPGRSRPRLSKEQAGVISWLRSPEGECWDEGRMDGPLERQRVDGGVFADVRGDISALMVSARWPEPHGCHDVESGDDDGDW